MRMAWGLLLAIAAPAFAQGSPVETILGSAPKGTRIGLVVTDDTGREIVAVLPDQRFIPASNTKMYTTAATFTTLADLDKPDADGGTSVSLERGVVTLHGRGDARMSSAPDCKTNCLATLADAVAARTKRVSGIIGDATWFPDQRWGAGMSWNNVAERSGTGIAALSLDDNEVSLVVTPGTAGKPPTFTVGPYFTIDNRATTIASGVNSLDVERLPFERVVRLTGNIAVGEAPDTIGLGIDDPAHYAAWTFERMLRARGVKVRGRIEARYRSLPTLASPEPVALARLTPPPLAEDIVRINKVSQNLHADLLLRRVGRASGDGSVTSGLGAIERMLIGAGVKREAYDFADGSGMSTYNRTSPRGIATFLNWIAMQPWGAAFRASLPIGGVDGTIARRFKGTLLDGKVFAKTGGLNATSALSGWLTAKSGRTLTFSILANDVPQGARAVPTMDAALVAVAEAN